MKYSKAIWILLVLTGFAPKLVSIILSYFWNDFNESNVASISLSYATLASLGFMFVCQIFLYKAEKAIKDENHRNQELIDK